MNGEESFADEKKSVGGRLRIKDVIFFLGMVVGAIIVMEVVLSVVWLLIAK